MRRFFMTWFFVVCLCSTVLGCAAVHHAIDNYKACNGNQQCLDEMNKVKDTTAVVSKTAAAAFPLPSVPECIAFLVSNIAAFGYGAWHGGKIKKS